MKKYKIKFLLVQIDEAHSTAWPIGLKDTPEPQKTFEERVERANKFAKNEEVPFNVYIDDWDNTFAETFRAWPDKYYCINQNHEVIGKSEYGTDGENDAKIIEDCTQLITKLVSDIEQNL